MKLAFTNYLSDLQEEDLALSCYTVNALIWVQTLTDTEATKEPFGLNVMGKRHQGDLFLGSLSG